MSARHETPAFRAAELAAILARHYPDAAPHNIAEVVAEMQRATRSRKALEERASGLPDHIDNCRDWTARVRMIEDYERNITKARVRSERMAQRINLRLKEPLLYDLQIVKDKLPTLWSNGAAIELGGDPRGPCGRLHVPGQRGDGFAIY